MPRARKLPDGMWKRGDTYYCRFRAQGREVRRRLSTDFTAACELLNELRARADRADFDILDNDYPWATLKTEFLKWADQSLRPRVSEEYRRDLKRFEQFTTIRSVRQVQPDLIFSFREWRLAQVIECRRKRRRKKQSAEQQLRTVSPRTVNRQVGTIVNMLNKGVQWGRIGANAIKDLRPLAHEALLKQRRSLSAVELQSLFDASPEHLKPVWRMFMCTGIRKGELVAMKFADVDFDRKVACVQAATAKSGRAREIPLDDTLLQMLVELRNQAKRRQPVPGLTATATERQRAAFTRDRVFVTQANTPWHNNLLKRFYAICKRAEIAGAERGGTVDIHSLRVTFTTLAIENGASPKAVQDILGHATLAMTMKIYAKATERSKRDAINMLPFATTSTPDHVISVQNAHTVRTSRKSLTQVGAKKCLA